ncbi:aldehyde dehydrogenase family protein, partial [Francisella noatunensis subsp. orientalis]|nr:aldehyde dehydrogenase family protein [Francisella orientalis]
MCLQELNLGLEAHITNDNKNVIETLSPATGELLAKVKNQNLDDMQYAITKAAEVAK